MRFMPFIFLVACGAYNPLIQCDCLEVVGKQDGKLNVLHCDSTEMWLDVSEIEYQTTNIGDCR